MNKIIVTLGSVTYAIKLRKLLAREDIESELVKVNTKETNGCTHGVKIDQKDLLRAVVIMREKGFEYSVFENK